MPPRKLVVAGAVAAVLALAGCADITTTGLAAGPDGSAASADTTMTSDPLEGTHWKVAESPGDGPDLADFEISTAFAEGRATGSAPVNTYFGDYEVDGDELHIAEIASTRMAGEPEAMEAENHFFTLLAEVASFQLEGSQLHLFDSSHAEVLIYEPLPDPTPPSEEARVAAAEKFAATLVGEPEEDAAAATEAEGYLFRVVSRDGQSLPVTADYRIDRINAEVNGGVVARVSVG